MKVVILAGGKGSRISEYTQDIPKPMIKIGEKPIIWHIMNTYSKFGYKNFYIALGYKSEIIKQYFLNYQTYSYDFQVNIKNKSIKMFDAQNEDWNVSLINTGINSMTGGRLKNLKKYIDDGPFFLSYGDSIGNVDLKKLYDFHKSHGKLVTVTAVRPQARFGELEILDNNIVQKFQEKPQVTTGWINGGYFVIEPKFLDYIADENTILEKYPLENVAKEGQLMAYKHFGNWHCMDTIRDKDNLDTLLKNNKILF